MKEPESTEDDEATQTLNDRESSQAMLGAYVDAPIEPPPTKSHELERHVTFQHPIATSADILPEKPEPKNTKTLDKNSTKPRTKLTR